MFLVVVGLKLYFIKWTKDMYDLSHWETSHSSAVLEEAWHMSVPRYQG